MSSVSSTGERYMTHDRPSRIERAIISVSDKTGLHAFARRLVECGVQLYSTGGTRKYLEEHGLSAIDIAEYTGFPEVMDGRVKTLHPKIFGGILCRRDRDDDMEVMDRLEMEQLDLVVVNLYPFEQTIQRSDVTQSMAIENIDIGGPSLVRAAAKNSQFVTIATSPDQYDAIAEQVESSGGTTLELRRQLMADAFTHTAQYDLNISEYFQSQMAKASAVGLGQSEPPKNWTLELSQASCLRYGENGHQAAWLYRSSDDTGASLVDAEQLHGKELSYNNYLDLDAALTIAHRCAEPACVVLKHNNPCGAATAPKLDDACRRAFAGDPTSAFGSIVGFNRPVDAETADYMAGDHLFVEAIIAPDFSSEATEILTTRPKWKKNVRLVRCAGPVSQPRWALRQVQGGMLVQQADNQPNQQDGWQVANDEIIDAELMAELVFAWDMVRSVKSNAIVLAKDFSLVGVGAGQMSRVDSVRIAIEKAAGRCAGSVLASDAFFPFPDSIEIAAAAGVRAIIQPGGSVKDNEVIAACKQHHLPLVLTGRRHFLH